MFTGIVQHLTRVHSADREDNLLRLSLNLQGMTEGLQTGASVAVNGVCLTVVRIEHDLIYFDVIPESLERTNLGDITAGDLVNVERSFRVGDEIGGHVVSGHVSGTARLTDRRVTGHDHVINLSVDEDWFRFIFHKGFIALDGASLTVSDVNRDAGTFQISLIPETLERTTLGHAAIGARINVEVDAQTVSSVETVERVMADPDWQERFRKLG